MPTSTPPLEVLLVFAGVVTLLALWPRTSSDRSIPRRRRIQAPTPRMGARNAAKPPWVHKEVLRLRALMPDYGCRKISIVFNHLHRQRRKMTVGKTFVATVLRQRQHEIAAISREIKHRRPKTIPPNIVWALDLTYLGDRSSKRTVLGLLDHGSRACLTLRDMRDKSSVAILRVILDAIERFGKPKYIRTDNEPVFTSAFLQLGLRLVGVRHQRTAPFAPRQNGRVERFFKTFKELAGSIKGGFLLLGMGWAPDRILLPLMTNRDKCSRCRGRVLSAASRCLDHDPASESLGRRRSMQR